MEYRKLPHGGEHERFSVLGLGMGGIGQTPPDEIEAIVCKAIDNGINFFDMCTAGATYAPFGRAIAGRREKFSYRFISVRCMMKRENTAGAEISRPSGKLFSGSWRLSERTM